MRGYLAATSSAIILSTVFIAAADGDWAYWRGPDATGMARGDAPLRWSDAESIRWKTTVPGRGFSSPVVWGDRLFLTTAVPADPVRLKADPTTEWRPQPRLVEHRFVVLCYDRKTGKLLWERVATTATPHELAHPTYGSFASNSPVTDGTHVFAFFGSRGLYAYTLDGRLAWQKEFPRLDMFMDFGEGAWTWLEDETLLVVLDHEGESFLLALDKATGKERWRTPRDGRTNWSGPYVTRANGRKQVIVSASREVVGYDFETGKRIWWARGLGQNTIPQPIAADGLAIVMSGYRNPNLMGIRLGRTGDLTDTDAIVWTNTRGNSYTPSPALHDGILYLLTDSGMLSALDAKTGKPHYQMQRLPKPYQFKSSPVGANGKLYLATEQDDVVVVRMGPTFEVLATNTLKDQTFIATPAIVDGEIYLRSQNTLFAIAGN
jgi:outer membrane protein assembly factor BamB